MAEAFNRLLAGRNAQIVLSAEQYAAAIGDSFEIVHMEQNIAGQSAGYFFLEGDGKHALLITHMTFEVRMDRAQVQLFHGAERSGGTAIEAHCANQYYHDVDREVPKLWHGAAPQSIGRPGFSVDIDPMAPEAGKAQAFRQYDAVPMVQRHDETMLITVGNESMDPGSVQISIGLVLLDSAPFERKWRL